MSKTQSHHNFIPNEQTQEELKAFMAIVETYHQELTHLSAEMEAYIGGDYIQDASLCNPLKIPLARFVEGVRQESFVNKYYETATNVGNILQQLILKMDRVFPEVIEQLSQLRTSHEQMREQLEDEKMRVEDGEEKLKVAEDQLREFIGMYEKTRQDNHDLSQRMSVKEKQYEKESKEITKNFMKAHQFSEKEQNAAKELHTVNDALKQQIETLQNEKEFIEQQFEKLEQENTRNLKIIQQLDQQIQKKDQKILAYEEQLQSLMLSQTTPFGRISAERENYPDDVGKSNNETTPAKNGMKSASYFMGSVQNFNDFKIPLSQEVGVQTYKVPTSSEFRGERGSFGVEEIDYYSQYEDPREIKQRQKDFSQKSQILNEEDENVEDRRKRSSTGKKGNNQNNDSHPRRSSNQSNKKNTFFDPYYSHYLLTCQAVKIRQDSEDMLNIDMKPHYSEIIDKRIPMHLWDQWIKNKLREKLNILQKNR